MRDHEVQDLIRQSTAIPSLRRHRRSDPTSTQRARRRRPTALVACTAALALSACGGSAKPSIPKRGAKSGTPGLAFSMCMRSHGLPDFPDPNVVSGYQVHVSGYHSSVTVGDIPGVNERSPAFLAAQNACQKLLPGGAAVPGQQHPAAAAIALARTAASCMRAHGVPNFPDPRTVMPSAPPANTVLDNINGAWSS